MTNVEKALEIKHDDPCCVWNDGCPNVYYAALKMAEWKDGHPSSAWIDKACDWLYKRQQIDLVVPNIEKFINDFKKAMEE